MTYAAYDEKDNWLRNVDAANEKEALEKAKANNPDAVRVELVSEAS